MASPAAPVDPGLAAVQSSAANALATAMANDAPSPTPSSPEPGQPQAPPASPPAAAAAPAAPVPPPAAPPQAPPAGQAPASTTIDTAGLSPEARRFLEMKGGDVDRALRDALDYNNRLAAAARPGAPAVAAPGTPGAPATAAAPPAPGTPPATPPVTAPQVPPAVVAPPEPQAIEAEVDGYTGRDQECLRLAQQWGNEDATIKALDTKYPNLESEIAYHTRRLQDPDVRDDAIAQGAIKETLQELKEARAERREADRQRQELSLHFDARADMYRQRINARYDAQRQQAESEAQVERHAQDLTQAWNPGISRAATKHNIPELLIPKFEVLSRQAALANLELGFTVNDLDAFLERQAQDFLEIVDQAHRQRSGEYGELARTRAAQPGPGEGVPAVATAQAPAATENLNDIYKAARERLNRGGV